MIKRADPVLLEGRSQTQVHNNYDKGGGPSPSTSMRESTKSFETLKLSQSCSVAEVTQSQEVLSKDFLNVYMRAERTEHVAGARGKTVNSCSMENSKAKNQSSVSFFLIVGLSDTADPQVHLFLVFLAVYLITVVGNIVILNVIYSDRRLHTPMYFFLANLAAVDIFLSSVTVPKLLFILVTAQKSISYAGCITQLYFFQLFMVVECYILTVMAYDRYVAICFPLNYTLIMSRAVRIRIVLTCWASGLLNSVVQAVSIGHLDFCNPNKVDHFFCDVTPLFKLSCSDTKVGEGLFMIVVVIAGMGPLIFILVTYGRIIAAVTKISTSNGRLKTFSTCASHFMVVALYYGSGIFSYIWPSSTYAMDKDVKVVAVLYTIMTPMLNPIIYSLRNREVKQALRKAMGIREISSKQQGNRKR
ncbi:olfactory receptor 5F1-like [Rhinoderma darwinii]|uniref:olfactory receptor 5F1-like n=1 Tax=Rhinoderma darwinii TaxID=43563 RepID=UPI003F67E344